MNERCFLSAELRGTLGWHGSTDPDSTHHNLVHTLDFNPVPIPAHAAPSREEDGHMAIVDWQTLTAWDILAAARTPDAVAEK